MLPPRLPSLRLLSRTIVLLCSAMLAVIPARAQEAGGKQPDAQEVLRAARFTAALQEGDLDGEISNDAGKIPFRMSLTGGMIRFGFNNPSQTIALHLDDDQFRFTEKMGEKPETAVPPKRHGENLRGTDITYEDLALRFLFWKRAQILEETDFKGRKAWKIRIDNPGTPGPYSVVYAWIDKESAALLRVQGYNQQGLCVKQFEVISGMKVKNGWMLKEMRVETMAGNPAKVVSRTYMRLNKPKDKPAGGERPDW